LKHRIIDAACDALSAERSWTSPGEVSVTSFTTSLHERAVGGASVAVGVAVGSAGGAEVVGGVPGGVAGGVARYSGLCG
jgi:hypothetical protein